MEREKIFFGVIYRLNWYLELLGAQVKKTACTIFRGFQSTAHHNGVVDNREGVKSSPYDINQSRNEEENEGTLRLFFCDFYLHKGTEEFCR